MIYPRVWLLSSAVLVVAAGCSKTTNETARTSDGTEVHMKGEGGNVSFETTSKTGEKTKLQVSAHGMDLPADFPKDVPIYPKALVRLANSSPSMQMLGLVLPVSIADGGKFYDEELKKQEWTVTHSGPMGEGYMITATKASRSCMIMISKDGKDNYAQITLSPGT